MLIISFLLKPLNQARLRFGVGIDPGRGAFV